MSTKCHMQADSVKMCINEKFNESKRFGYKNMNRKSNIDEKQMEFYMVWMKRLIAYVHKIIINYMI